ncbi:MAG: cytochrome c biogenesis protein ResB [Pseudomonadota bacterium]
MNKKGTASDFVDTLWNFFASVRLTVVILLTLAVSSVIGTLIPQNAAKAEYISKYGVEIYRVFSVLNLMDMYHSWWFRFFMCMLTLNVLVCSLDRLSATFKIVFVRVPVFNVTRFRNLQGNSEILSSRSPADLLDSYTPIVSRWFRYSRTETTDSGHCIFAEKGRWTRLGFYLVHLSIVLLLLGGLIGSIFGFDGFVNIPEGESTDQVRLNGGAKMIPLNFRIQCDDFAVSFYETGQPREFRSRLTLLEGGNPVLTQDIIVNSPLRYKGINIFQSSYGAVAPENLNASDMVELSFEDAQTKAAFSVKVRIGQTIDLPENLGTFQLMALADSKAFRGMDLGQTLVGQLTLTGKTPEEILLPTRFPQFDKMRKGRFLISLGNRYYTGLQVTRDPGVWLVYFGFLMLIGGCLVTFFMSHQRLCIEIIPGKKESRVILAGVSNKNKLGMQNAVKRLSARLKGLDG